MYFSLIAVFFKMVEITQFHQFPYKPQNLISHLVFAVKPPLVFTDSVVIFLIRKAKCDRKKIILKIE